MSKLISVFAVSVLLGCLGVVGGTASAVAQTAPLTEPPHGPLVIAPGEDAENGTGTLDCPDRSNPPEADIHLAAEVTTNGEEDWQIHVTGIRNGVALDHWAVMEEAGITTAYWQPALPYYSDDLCEDYRLIDAFQPDVLEDILDADDLHHDCPTCTVSKAEMSIDFPSGGYDFSDLGPVEATVRLLYPTDLTVYDATGREISLEEAGEKLLQECGLTEEEASRILGTELDHRDTQRIMVTAAKRQLKAHGFTEPLIRKLERMAVEHRGDLPGYLALARQEITSAGLDSESISAVDTSLVVLATGETRELTISVTMEAEVTVEIPPFVSVKVKAAVTITGPVSDYNEIMSKAAAMADALANHLAARVKERIERIKKTIEEEAPKVLPWFRWLLLP